ncbi:MAG: GxxExxY protein [Chloroflexi bacterium]|nr:GxxExxY protein [Chloroflexota bacterium]
MPQPSKHQFEPLSYKVIGVCIDVQKQLGLHCMEVDYQRALELALPQFGVQCAREVEIPIVYAGIIVTKRRVDFKCWDERDELLLESKAAQAIRPDDAEQCLLYITKANQKLDLPVNFGEKPLRPRRFVNTPPETAR